MTEAAPLGQLRDRPWALLREMERRAWAMAGETGAAPEAREWVGIGFRLGDERFLAPRDEVREITACPVALARVPGAKDWVAGLTSLRGQLLTVIDLKAFLGGGATRLGRDSRILVINHRELGAGLLVDEILGFRRYPEATRVAAPAETTLRCSRYLAGAFGPADEPWPVFNLAALTESPSFLQAANDG
jgi:twitching motility protein PilI